MLFRKMALVALSGLALVAFPAFASPAQKHHELSYAARQRMYNKARLLKSWKQKSEANKRRIVSGNSHSRAEKRAENRRQLQAHPEWFPAPLEETDLRWGHLNNREEADNTPHLHNTTEQIVARLEKQLGKPYRWGGTSPGKGFDCSGLVYYAYNHLLAEKLPRTANEMYHYTRARRIAKNDLRRGDLVFFHVHTRGDKADHVGVYLGRDEFIEAPRTGENIRISHFGQDFWQDHYLGARRILLADNVQ